MRGRCRRCGPCKVFKPTFVAAAKEHAGRALFLSCMGDSNASTAKIMKRLAIKCVASHCAPRFCDTARPLSVALTRVCMRAAQGGAVLHRLQGRRKRVPVQRRQQGGVRREAGGERVGRRPRAAGCIIACCTYHSLFLYCFSCSRPDRRSGGMVAGATVCCVTDLSICDAQPRVVHARHAARRVPQARMPDGANACVRIAAFRIVPLSAPLHTHPPRPHARAHHWNCFIGCASIHPWYIQLPISPSEPMALRPAPSMRPLGPPRA
jgi:hypothetical protein